MRPSSVEEDTAGHHEYQWRNGTTLVVKKTAERSYEQELHMNLYLRALALLADQKQRYDPWCVLDAPCGTGYGTALFSAAGATALGVDCARDATDYATRRAPEATIAQATLGDRLAAADGKFAAIVCIEGIEHIEHDAAAMAEFHRVLCHNGRLVITTPEDSCFEGTTRTRERSPFHLREYTQAQFAALIHDTGFRIEHWERIEWTMLVMAVRR